MRKISSFDTKTKERPSRAQCSLCIVTEWSKAAVNSLPCWSPALPPTGSRETCSHTPSSYFFPYCHNVCISTHKCKFQVAIKTWNRLGNKYSKYFFFTVLSRTSRPHELSMKIVALRPKSVTVFWKFLDLCQNLSEEFQEENLHAAIRGHRLHPLYTPI